MTRNTILITIAAISLLSVIHESQAQIMLGMSKKAVVKKYGEAKILNENTPSKEEPAHLQLVSYKIDGVNVWIMYSNIRVQEFIEKKGDVVHHTNKKIELAEPEVSMIWTRLSGAESTPKSIIKRLAKFTGVKEWEPCMGGFVTKRRNDAEKNHQEPEGVDAAAGYMQEELRFGDFLRKGDFLGVGFPQ